MGGGYGRGRPRGRLGSETGEGEGEERENIPWSCMSSQPQYRFAAFEVDDDDDVASVRVSRRVSASNVCICKAIVC
jgi:hypothetical protein